MKKIFLTCCLVAFCFFGWAQKIKVSEVNEKIADGKHSALMVTVYEADKKTVEKAWKSTMKNMGAKVSMKKEVFADDASHKDMGDNTFDVYAKAVETSDGVVEFTIAVDLGGAFMNSGEHSSQVKAMKDILHNFAVETTKEALGNKLKDAEKELKGLEKDQQKLEKENQSLHDDIKDYEAKIKQAKQDIEENKKAQEKKKKEIDSQQKVVKDFETKEKAVK